jgi:hypothetical protein
MSEIAFTIGVGLMVTVKVFVFAPTLTHPFFDADTTIVPTMSTPVLFVGAVYTISPEPLNPMPIAALLFVHDSAAPITSLVKGILTDSPAQ